MRKEHLAHPVGRRMSTNERNRRGLVSTRRLSIPPIKQLTHTRALSVRRCKQHRGRRDAIIFPVMLNRWQQQLTPGRRGKRSNAPDSLSFFSVSPLSPLVAAAQLPVGDGDSEARPVRKATKSNPEYMVRANGQRFALRWVSRAQRQSRSLRVGAVA